ncbi:MAG: hypothetical protein Q8M98_07205 [Candidatus Cloacimonadaceae bacterium]|nr:hypothetical protein [Candidatus Cloacimonadaceae bacterium]MDP3114549.1 hypothetical protein [Candidatus Cloacimonadaceae bacterium]
MDQTLLKALAKELAARVNRMVNIPLIPEDQEQVFFEMIMEIILDWVLKALGWETIKRLAKNVAIKTKR